MSAKPSDVGRFATTVVGVDASNISAPSAGLQDNGWPTNAVPTSRNLNYLENIAYKWRKYLSDGDLTLHNVTGNNITADASLIVSGIVGGAEFSVAGSVPSTMGGPVTMNSGLTVAGSVTLGDNSAADTVTINADVTLSAGSDLTVNGNTIVSALAAGALLITTNQNVTLAGTGKIVHGTRTRTNHLNVSMAIPVSGGAPTSPSSGFEGFIVPAGGTVRIPVPITDTNETVRTVTIADRFGGAAYTISLVTSTTSGSYSAVTTTGGSGTGIVTATITSGKQLATHEKLWIEVLGPAGGLHVTVVTCTYDSV